MEENPVFKNYFLIRTEREGVGEIWALPDIKPELFSKDNSLSGYIHLEFDPEVFQNGLPLTPDEVLRKGSARLQGILKESDFPPFDLSIDSSQSRIKAHLEFLVSWGFPGGFIGGYEFYPQIAEFLKNFLRVHINSKVLITGPKRALSLLGQFFEETDRLFLLPPNALEAHNKKEPVSLVFILEADQIVSLSSPYFSALLNIPKRIALAQFSTRDFLKAPRREALSAIFGVSYYSVIWDSCVLDPNSFSFFEPKSYAWVTEQSNSVNFAEFVLEEEPYPDAQAISSGLAIPGERAVKARPSFFESAQLLAREGGEKAEFVPFRKYYPTYADLSPAQLKWYLYWRSQARKGQFLPTDLSYIFLYVYELINNIGVADRLEGLGKLRELWLNYRERYPRLDHYLVDWMADYIIVYKCPVDFMEIYKEALEFGFIRNPDLLLEEFLQGPLEGIPLSLWEELSFYKFLKSPFFRQERDQNLHLQVK
ncbi:MAG: TerB N-terminal domain-containing protein, partial [bacterium]